MSGSNSGLDYGELGFKCGIEIHQQLEGKKLFCDCPTEIRRDKPDFEIVRRLRASAGEQGKVDAAALHEQKKQKYFVYQGYDDITCGVEIDEEPPHPVNRKALRTALLVAKMLNCRIADCIQVMRKTVIDGSNVSGFQRTALIGVDGFVEVDGRKFRVDTICLEEEACQVIERTPTHDVYNLSRLGIPLLEIATAPDMKTPEEARDVAAKIGMILRSTEACKRGIGSIRQDVNLSVKGGARVEIKGFQELKSIPKVIEYEVKRQLDMIKKKEKMKEEVRKAEPDFTTSFLRPMPGMDRMYPETDIPEIVPNVKGIRIVQTIEQKIGELMERHKLAKELASQVIKAGIDLTSYAEKFPKLEPKFIADTLINAPKEIKARFGKELDALAHADELFGKVDKGELPKGAVFEILSEIAHGKRPDFSKYKGLSSEELEKEIEALVKKEKDATVQALMGMIMGRHRGKVDGKTVMELLRKHKK